MPDEIPPAPSESSEEDASKAETIRISLPAKTEQPTAKRETVRINLPGKPAAMPLGGGPKKETTKIPPAEGVTMAAPAPTAAKPFVPPPPKPPSSLASGALKPVSGITPPPKPPSLGGKPMMPLKPAAAPTGVAKPVLPAASGTNPAMEPVTQRAASPKKETARITLPPEGGSKPALPKATIKMQQTQPLVKGPGASVSSQSSLQPVATLTTASVAAAPIEAEPDGLVNVLAIAALLISLVSLGLVYWAFSVSSVS